MNKMKNHNNKAGSIFVVYIIFATMLVSCDDFLERAPLDELSQENYWKTPAHLDAYIVGKYNWLPGQLSTWGMGYFIEDIHSDNMVSGQNHQAWMNGENNTTPASGGDWQWGAIREINMFFDNVHQCESPFDSYKQTYGEACFLKAYKYHELVRKFGDIPWYTSVVEMGYEEALYKARDSRAVVMDSVMSLIDKSIDFLEKRESVGVNRLNKETALIFKSRVALFEATWAKYHNGTPTESVIDADAYFQKAIDAYTQFNQLIGGFEGKLYSTGNPGQDYYNLFNRFDYAGIEEVTLSKKYSKALNVPNNVNVQVWKYGYYGASYTLELVRSYLSNTGESVNILDSDIVDKKGAAYLTQLAGLLDPRFKQSTFIPGDLINSQEDTTFVIPQMHLSEASRNTTTGFSPKKGHNPDGPMNNHTDPLVDGIAFRLPELMLNYVEAYVELNGAFPDLSDNIDLLRERVGMPTLTEVKPLVESWWPDYGYSISDELAIVRLERRVELAGEGYRMDDWKRWRAHDLFDGKRPKGFLYDPADYEEYETKPSVPVDEDGYMDPYKVSLNGGGFNFNADRDYLSPLPLDQLILNKNLKQNPGWESPN